MARSKKKKKGKIPCFALRSGTFSDREARGTSVNEGGTVLVYLLEIDDKFTWVVLGICEDFRTKECDDVIRNDTGFFVLEISVVDTKIGVKPVDLPWDELPGNKALKRAQSC